MPLLEHKVPPPLVALLFAGAMWLLSVMAAATRVDFPWRPHIAGSIALLGGLFSAGGFLAFRRAMTTVNPLNPSGASSVVTSGIYRITRNPMYVGLLFVLIGLTVYLGAPLTVLGPIGFAMYIHRFQIIPEEQALTAKFGDEYRRYMSRVRRWL